MKKVLILSSLVVGLILAMIFLLPNYNKEIKEESVAMSEEYLQARLAVDEYERRTKEYYSEENVKSREEQAEKDRIRASDAYLKDKYYGNQKSKDEITESIRKQNEQAKNTLSDPSKSNKSYGYMLAQIELGKTLPDKFTVDLWELLVDSLSRKTGDSDKEVFSNLTALHILWNQNIGTRSIFSIACDIDEAIEYEKVNTMSELCSVYYASGLVGKSLTSGK